MKRTRICIVVMVIMIRTPMLRADNATIDHAISSGLAYLVKQQNGDGSFETPDRPLETAGLSLLAFLSSGNTADGGKYAATVRRATEFLLRQTPADRYFGGVDGSQMRGQAIVTLALAQAYGVEPDEATRSRIRAIVKDAVAVVIAAQNVKKSADDDGGWGVDQVARDSDVTISQTCLEALLAASQIGLGIPRENLDRAAAYLARHPHNSTTQPDMNRLIEAQSHDGSWPADATIAEPTAAASNPVTATSLTILRLSGSLNLRPIALP